MQRRQPVAAQDGRKARLGEEPADEAEQGRVAVSPAATVQEEDQRALPAQGVALIMKGHVLLRVRAELQPFLGDLTGALVGPP
jgi:hypothetical protein